jgi:hypothetical protein
MKNIANTSRVITITPKISSWIPGTPTYVENQSSKVNVGGAPMLLEKIEWTMAGCTFVPNTFNSGGSAGGAPIAATATKVRELNKNKYPLRVDDVGVCAGTFTTPVGVVLPCICDFKITDAGQTKVKCN